MLIFRGNLLVCDITSSGSHLDNIVQLVPGIMKKTKNKIRNQLSEVKSGCEVLAGSVKQYRQE